MQSIFQKIRSFLVKRPSLPKLVCIIGPTASGKSGAALEIARHFGGEIINADSKQMYRYLQIGTAKPTREDMKGVPHHLYDMLDPREQCNVAEWREQAQEVIGDILSRHQLPIVCGGTGLFVNALTQNFTLHQIAPQQEFRAQMERMSGEQLWKKLHAVDPDAAERIPVQNKRFLIRALEVYEVSGQKKSEAMQMEQSLYDTFFVGLTMDRSKLYARINARVEEMKKEGFLTEVQSLLARGYSASDYAFTSIGYREAIGFLQGEISEQDFWEQMKMQSRRYAKRQLTWWRRDDRVHWFDSVSHEPINIRAPEF